MAESIAKRLEELGISIPVVSTPAANYLGFVVTGNLVFLSGQVPMQDGRRRYIGKVGREFNIDEGRSAAELAALNLLAQLKEACGGDLDRVVRCVKLTGFVNGDGDFVDHPKVINGASDLIVKIFGDAGRHARSAVGMHSLPSGVAVEVEAVFEIAC
jgi:enamine deaminase RidA (YjgF/YER057c/UK114 family)